MATGNAVKIQLGETEYQIVVGEQESGWMDYGEALDAEIGGVRYLALVEEDPDDGEQVRSALGDVWVYCVSAGLESVELEDVDDADDAEEGEEGEGEEGEEATDADDK